MASESRQEARTDQRPDDHEFPDDSELLKLRSEDLMQSQRMVLIIHNGETYRLRITSNGKLLLTK